MKTKLRTLVPVLAFMTSAYGQAADEESSEFNTDRSGACANFTIPNDGHTYYCSRYPLHDITGNSAGMRETLFRISSAFNEPQRAKIMAGLDIAMEAVGRHFAERYVEKLPQSSFQQCVKQHAYTYFEPVNAAINGRDAVFYADIAMGSITLLQNFHESRDVPVDISPINLPATDSIVVGQAYLGQDSTKVGATQNMNFKVNIQALNFAFINNQLLAGTFIHEWMHRAGFDHADDDTGTLVDAAGDCVQYGYEVPAGTGLLEGLKIIR
jgi:hypothetical protein